MAEDKERLFSKFYEDEEEGEGDEPSMKALLENVDKRPSQDFAPQTVDPALPGQVGSVNAPQANGAGDGLPNGGGGQMPGEQQEEEEQKPRKITLRQKLTFAGIAITYMSTLMSFSVLAPFFPNEAKKKDVNSTETGLVFGFFALINFISAPILGKYLPVLGAKFMFLSGSFLSAGCNVLFGFLDELHGKTIFLTYCFIIRAVEALGSAATITAGMAICASAFPDNVAQMSGMLEMFSGLGFAVGPPLGSLFYGIGGYKLPFIVLGSFAIFMSIVNVFIMPNPVPRSSDEKTGSLLSVARIPAVWIILIVCMWGSASLGFSDPTLSVHLTSPPLKIKDSLVGVLFLLIGGTYGATAPIWGYIADKKKTTRIMMALGFYLSGLSFMLIGPSPLLNLPSKLWIVIVALSLMGLSIGVALMPAFLDLLMSAKWYGLPDNLATHGVISGVFSGAFSLGTFIGPTIAGALVDNFGFDWSATLFAGGNFIAMILICLFGVWEYQCGKGRRKPPHLRDSPYPEIVGRESPAITA
ncbi:MFS-type transporter SLC18B1-like [Diadema antillarum]|uniref:MFS-type transporter SLC18B1-like n=1 Tax=Diadema antillarum TaxID=105358 RepID=UPI003A8C22AF